jgi:uncharacterized protein with FMN-binding domain
MNRKVLIPCACLFLLALLTAGCRSAAVVGGPVDAARLTDGVFRGESKHGPNKAVVEVTVRDRRIVEVKILENDAWKGKKAADVIGRRIVEKQSTSVDAVSGATNSSNVIMNAVEQALVQSTGRPAAQKETAQ